MLGIIISILAGAAISSVVFRDHGPIWGTIIFLLGFAIANIVIILVLRKKITNLQLGIQNIILESQKQCNVQIANFQRRPPASQQAAYAQLEKIQRAGVEKALAAMDCFKSYYKWNILLNRQLNGMRVHLLYQIKDFKQVDKLLPYTIAFDAQTMAIALVRKYKNKAKDFDKYFNSKSMRLKGDQRAFFACVYAWLKLKNQSKEGLQAAIAALVAAKKVSDNKVLVDNHANLINNKVKHFNNAGFGDIWYGLFLEEPKQPKPVRQQRMY